MQTKIQILMDLLELNKAQATDIVGRYLKDIKDIHAFLDFYFETLERESIIGTTYEKLRRVCKRAEIAFKKRFEDKEIFYEWLCDQYKNQACFRVRQGDFSYSFLARCGDKMIRMHKVVDEHIICINHYKQIAYEDGEPLRNDAFKEAVLEFMFYHQERLGKDLHTPLKLAKALKLLSLEEKREVEKEEEKRLVKEHLAKFEAGINHAKLFKNIS